MLVWIDATGSANADLARIGKDRFGAALEQQVRAEDRCRWVSVDFFADGHCRLFCRHGKPANA
jgi:hypothetical protein